MNWVGSGNVTDLISVDTLLKSHAQLTGVGSGFDSLLTAYVSAASVEIENKVGYPLRYTAVTVFQITGNDGVLNLPKNINAVTAYYYWDNNEWTEQTFTTAPVRNDFRLESELVSADIKRWFRYKLVCTAYVNTNELLKQACRMRVAEMFERREDQDVKYNDSTLDRLLRTEGIMIQ
ncbi:MAG: phage gp6-like head-tail connector protein [Saprospiraceae bacterium]|nr:phage gp6-like head-tail connector protein [Saprospiraceae bacterium]